MKDLVTGKNVSSCAEISRTNTRRVENRNFIDNVLNRLCQSSGPEEDGHSLFETSIPPCVSPKISAHYCVSKQLCNISGSR